MGRVVSAVPLLARRFLLSKVSDQFLSLIAWVSVVGVALGVLALTVVTSVMNGFEGELRRVITGMNGDVVLYSQGATVQDPELIEQKIRKIVPGLRAITPSFVSELMVGGPNRVTGAVIEGIDLETIGQVTEIPRRLVEGRLPQGPGEVVLAKGLAEKLGATTGSEVRLIAPFVQVEDSSGGAAPPRVVQAHVVGIAALGMYEYDSKFLFATLPQVQEFLDQKGRVTSFKLSLGSGVDSWMVSDRLIDSFGSPFRAKNWAQLNKNIFYAVQLEKVVIVIILTVIVIVAAFNVVSTLMMMIHDKSKEIAILKAMGFGPAQSFRLFCLIGLGMGIVGTFFGVGAGLGLSWILEKTRWISLPADIYYISFLPVVVRWQEVGLIALSAILISFVATFLPAWQVSRRSPLEGLRYDS